MDIGSLLLIMGIFGCMTALIGPRKGKDPKEAFMWGAMLGVIGLFLMVIQPDEPEAATRKLRS